MVTPNVRSYLNRSRVVFFLTVALITSAIAFSFRSSAAPGATISLTAVNVPKTENFNGLAVTGTTNSPSTMPTSWTMSESGTSANGFYAANNGSNNAGDVYSYGSAASSDKALGCLQSNTLIPMFGANFTNNTGSAITSLDIAYTGEQWRIGNTAAARDDRLDFQYSLDATDLTTGTWVNVDSLDFTNPVKTAAVAGPLDGNAAGNRTPISSSITGVFIPNGVTFWIRWTDFNATGADDGLAIDDFSLTPHSAGPTSPTGTGTANPNSVAPTDSTLLTVTVTPGTNPTSTAHTVTVDLTAIGGSATQQFFDNGTNGDAVAGDNTFSFSATVANGTAGGSKSLPFTVTETAPLSRSSGGSISLNVLASTDPSGSGAANPNPVVAGNGSLLTVIVNPGTNPTSTGVNVTADLSSIGGSASQQLFNDGTHGDVTPNNNVWSFNATVSLATSPGLKALPVQITDAQGRSASTSISLTVQAAPPPAGAVVISQHYGGGGNSGAAFKNDYIEIFNRSANPIDLTSWSVQYASAVGTSWQKTTLTGVVLQPGQYYLVQEAAGSGGTTDLPTPDAVGTINMSATSGKVALVRDNNALTGACPLADAELMDFVGYGTANCFEGAAAAPALDNVTANFRSHLGCKDTDSNGGNFTTGSPTPRNTLSPFNVCTAGDFPPEIFRTSPATNEAHIPVDANITVNFDEPVNVSGNWFQISCTTTGVHPATVSGGPISFTLNPDTDFAFNEPCTVTVFASQVTDQDFNDPPDNMAADYVFSFNSEFLRDPAEHMLMGNPSGATADTNFPDNYLMMKVQYALSYNNSKRIPNWTSWHLDSSWRGSAPRQDDFREDTTLPAGFNQVLGTDYSGTGFDRGHMCPSADRTSTIPDNSATFLMTNMIPQAPGNNQGPWAALENSLRSFLPDNELYIVSGGSGVGGVGSNGASSLLPSGVTVPAFTWKVALILPVGDNDVARVDNNTRVIAVIMPNNQNIQPDQWQKYLATVDQVEALTGYDLYSNVPVEIQDVIESRVDAANDTAPVTSDQTKSVAEDGNVPVTLSASDFNVNNTFTFTVVDQPLHGTLSGSGANLVYTPNANYSGPDSFTFKANDSALDSNVSTVNITVTEVNDDPTAVNDSKQTAEGSPLNFAASELTANDSAGPEESGQTLAVDSVITTPNTHGTVVLSSGQITYTPAADYNGPASFDYHVCDDGTTNGSLDSKCATGTVNVTVTEVNNAPTASDDNKTTSEDTPLVFDASTLTTNDSAGPANESTQTLTVTSVTATANTHGTVSLSSGHISYTPAANYNGPASFTYSVCDDGTTNGVLDPQCTSANVNVSVSPVNDAPTLNGVPSNATIDELAAYSFTASASDVDVPAQTLTFSLVGAPSGASIDPATGVFLWTPTEAQGGTGVPYSFTVRVSDGITSTDAAIQLSVNEVNQAPKLNPIGDKNVAPGATLQFTASGSDADVPAQSLSFSLVNAPAGASIDPYTGAFSWTTTIAQVGQVYTFKVRLTDNGTPNLSAEEQINVGVGYSWSGLLAPIEAGGVYKIGRTLPIKFQLTGPSAGITNLIARLLICKVSNNVVGAPVKVQSTSTATTSNLFRYSGDGYIFNLDTADLSPGTYQLRVDLGDGVFRAVCISLK